MKRLRLIPAAISLLLLLTGCGRTAEKEDDPLPLPDPGVVAEKAEDVALAGGRIWILSDGKVRSAGEDGEELPGVPEDYRAAFLASDGKNPVLCSADGTLFWDGELIPTSDEPRVVTSFAVAGNTNLLSTNNIAHV